MILVQVLQGARLVVGLDLVGVQVQLCEFVRAQQICGFGVERDQTLELVAEQCELIKIVLKQLVHERNHIGDHHTLLATERAHGNASLASEFTRETTLGLQTNRCHVEITLGLAGNTLCKTDNTVVDGTTETTIGSDGDDAMTLTRSSRCQFSLSCVLCVYRVVHGVEPLLCNLETVLCLLLFGRGHSLHGECDLSNVLDCLDTVLNLLQSSHRASWSLTHRLYSSPSNDTRSTT
mmetsp:Transcript_12951/g.33052  ORF Transcript_12951/g.33052 Transcript_12951/m.33052 type:complete len:235 (+) Transcript_12951:259-963(+)